MSGTYSEIDDIKIWNADLNPNWAARKKTLPPNKIIPPKPPTAEKRFNNLDKNNDGSISLKEFTNPRTPDKRAAAEICRCFDSDVLIHVALRSAGAFEAVRISLAARMIAF